MTQKDFTPEQIIEFGLTNEVIKQFNAYETLNEVFNNISRSNDEKNAILESVKNDIGEEKFDILIANILKEQHFV